MNAPKIPYRKPQGPVVGTATAPLLYWLAVICGLTGITVIRIDQIQEVIPIWFGAIVGVSLGQLVAVLRIRVWATALVALMSSWIVGPAIYIGLCELFGFGADTQTALMALLPAFICGYASLTERGGLIAFWYPAMLWMLVILDGEAPGSFAPRAYLPMAIGLGVFFVAFLRARETRRAALWRAYAHERLAKPGESAVLSGSPVRGMSQLGFTALIGGGAFLLAAWVAPNLFQKDRAIHQKLAQIPPPVRYASEGSSVRCCPETWATEKVTEYLPLHNAHDKSSSLDLACMSCPAPVPLEAWRPYGQHRGAGIRAMDPMLDDGYGSYAYYPRTELTYAYNPDGTTSYSWNTVPGNGGYGGYAPSYATPDYTTPSYGTPSYTTPSYTTPSYTTPFVEPVPPSKPVKPIKPATVAPTPTVNPTVNPGMKPPPIVSPPPTPAVKPVVKPAVVHAPTPVAQPEKPKTPPASKPTPEPKPEVTPASHPTAPPEPGAPWGVLLPLLAGVFLVPLGTRFVRRQVTLRHLARPFWDESIDQRISNHWQRMLIGLRDAGIQLRSTEQPGAFAKRIALEGMDECATILERVRHGVRVEDEDLAAMGHKTDAIYRAAQKKAGVAGRIAGSFRWPLV